MSRRTGVEAYVAKYVSKTGSSQLGPLPTAPRLWSPAEAAEFLGVPIKTLHRWRYVREGPPSFKVGRHLRYDPDAVRRWLVEECAADWCA